MTQPSPVAIMSRGARESSAPRPSRMRRSEHRPTPGPRNSNRSTPLQIDHNLAHDTTSSSQSQPPQDHHVGVSLHAGTFQYPPPYDLPWNSAGVPESYPPASPYMLWTDPDRHSYTAYPSWHTESRIPQYPVSQNADGSDSWPTVQTAQPSDDVEAEGSVAYGHNDILLHMGTQYQPQQYPFHYQPSVSLNSTANSSWIPPGFSQQESHRSLPQRTSSTHSFRSSADIAPRMGVVPNHMHSSYNGTPFNKTQPGPSFASANPSSRTIRLGLDDAGDSRSALTKLSNEFRRKSSRFFKVGKVFRILWTEPGGSSSDTRSISSQTTTESKYGEAIFSKVRTFIVVREGPSYSTAISIRSYSGRGVTKRGMAPHEHARVYTGKDPPSPLLGEEELLPISIRVVPDVPHDTLLGASRIDFGRVYTIEHNIKVKSFGMVHQADKPQLLRSFLHVLSGPMVSNQNTPVNLFGPKALSLDDGDRKTADAAGSTITDDTLRKAGTEVLWSEVVAGNADL